MYYNSIIYIVDDYMQIIRGYIFRLYPNIEQQLIEKSFV